MANTDVTLLDQFNSLIPSDYDRDVTFTSFEEAVLSAGLSEEQITLVTSPYRVIDNKDELIAKPFFIMSARFARDEKTEQAYVVLYAMTQDNEQVIVTDGSTGIFSQIGKEIAKRIEAKHPTPAQNFLVVNGLRKSEYDLTEVHGKPQPAKAGEKVSGTGVTYYLA